MKKLFATLVLALGIGFAVSAASLCGEGIKFEFLGGMNGNFVMTTSSGHQLKGTYLFDRKNNIRIVWENSGKLETLEYVEDGVYSWGRVTLKEC